MSRLAAHSTHFHRHRQLLPPRSHHLGLITGIGRVRGERRDCAIPQWKAPLEVRSCDHGKVDPKRVYFEGALLCYLMGC